MKRRWMLIACATSVAACAEAVAPAGVCDTPAEVTLTLASGPLLNPDENGEPLPTEIRVHEVRDPAVFETAGFEEAWLPEGALSESIVSTQSVTLYPGEATSLALVPSPEAHALIGVAIVRRPAGRTWRVIVPVDALACGARAALTLDVDEYRIERATETR